MKKEERLAFISKIIQENEIKTQEELVLALLSEGVEVTQATISRDIKSLALIKLPATSGGYRYDLPKNRTILSGGLQSERDFDTILQVKRSEKMLSIRANPGTTSLLKNQLLHAYESEIFSILIDDDSILVIFETEEAAEQLYQVLAE